MQGNNIYPIFTTSSNKAGDRETLIKMITLKTLKDATAQEVFDQVAAHLLTQGQKSEGRDENCLYRGPDGLKCAAGCLIADDEYDNEMEGRAWSVTVGFPPAHSELIRALQFIHDGWPCEEWPTKIKGVASNFGLSALIVDTYKANEQ